MPKGRPPATADTVRGKRKGTIEARKEAEESLKTTRKQCMSDAVKNDPLATRYFLRLVELYESIDMNEAFFENAINRYCLLLSEHDRLVEEQRMLMMTSDKDKEDYKILNTMGRNIANIRNQLLAIEKENLLTVQSKLRAIPKTKKEIEVSPLEQFKQKYSS